jgi:hypothetical protein
MTKYLLSCSCGKSNPIELAQAGETINCQCGAMIVAPTMRGIKALPIVADEAPVRRARAWGPGQGLSFLGIVVSLAGLATLGYCYGTQPKLDLDKIPPQFESITLIDSWRVWELFQRGLPGLPTPETMQIVKGAQGRQQLFTTGCVVAALGVVIMAIGVAYILAFEPQRKRTS